jgi:uncharacterized coiled-coil protein SlyX
VTPADTSFQSVMLWVAALSMLVSLGTALWNIFSGPSKKNGASIAELSSRIGAQEVEVQRLRDKVEALPNASMMHRLELALARMEGHIDRLDERLKPVTAIAERMQDLLIEQGKK